MSVMQRSIPALFALALMSAIACDQEPLSPVAVPDESPAFDLAGPDEAVLFLRFNQDLIDESPYGHTVMTEGYSQDPMFRDGCADGALLLDGEEFAYLDYDAVLEPEDVTVEVWFSPGHALANSKEFHPLLVKYAGNFWNTVDGYDLWYQDSGAGGRIGFGIGTANGTIRKHASLTTVFPAGKAIHVVGTFDGTNAKLYVNGKLEAVTPHDGSLAYRGGGIRIGGGVYHSYYGGEQYYRGLVDQVAIFPWAMSAGEVRERSRTCHRTDFTETGQDGRGGTDLTSAP